MVLCLILNDYQLVQLFVSLAIFYSIKFSSFFSPHLKKTTNEIQGHGSSDTDARTQLHLAKITNKYFIFVNFNCNYEAIVGINLYVVKFSFLI